MLRLFFLWFLPDRGRKLYLRSQELSKQRVGFLWGLSSSLVTKHRLLVSLTPLSNRSESLVFALEGSSRIIRGGRIILPLSPCTIRLGDESCHAKAQRSHAICPCGVSGQAGERTPKSCTY